MGPSTGARITSAWSHPASRESHIPVTFTKDERKAIWRHSRLLLNGLPIALAVLTPFGIVPWPEIFTGFLWILIVAAVWIAAHDVIEYIEANS